MDVLFGCRHTFATAAMIRVDCILVTSFFQFTISPEPRLASWSNLEVILTLIDRPTPPWHLGTLRSYPFSRNFTLNIKNHCESML